MTPSKLDEICFILKDIVEILRTQAKELEFMTKDVAQMTAHLREEGHFSLLASQLAGIDFRLDDLLKNPKSDRPSKNGEASAEAAMHHS